LARIESKTKEEAAHVRVLELEWLDRLLKPMMERAEDGMREAVDRVLKICERRSKLLGLDAPTKVSATDPTGERLYRPHLRILKILQAAKARRDAKLAQDDRDRFQLGDNPANDRSDEVAIEDSSPRDIVPAT
jgi:hypothetical protein